MGVKQVRRFMKRVLNSHEFHVSVIVLVIIDCFVLTAELIIDHLNDALLKDPAVFVSSEKSTNSSHSTIDAMTASKKHAEFNHHSGGGGGGGEFGHSRSGFGAWGPFFHMLEEIFKYTSLIILSIFVIEIFLKLIFIPRTFCKCLEIFDAFIVISSFSLNLYLLNKKHHIHSITGLITFLR